LRAIPLKYEQRLQNPLRAMHRRQLGKVYYRERLWWAAAAGRDGAGA